MASKLEKLNIRKEKNINKILEFQEKIKALQKENADLEKKMQEEKNKEILAVLTENNISLKEIKEMFNKSKSNEQTEVLNNSNETKTFF